MAEGPSPTAAEANRAYYERAQRGRDDYWRLMAAPRHRVRTLLGELARHPPTSVIDLGCGGGALLEEVAERFPGARLAGLDLSAAQITDNAARHPARSWYSLDLEGAAPLDPALEGAFEAVIASEVIEHLDRPAALLERARRLAAPGRGRLYLTTQSGPLRETERRVGHRRHYHAPELAALLREAGWAVEKIWNTGFPFHDLSKWYANRDPDGSMSRFSDAAYGPRERALCLALRLAFRLNSRRRGAQLFAVAVRP
jgi:cyclopropane fatty-acyl-phospholipid synthase-like methyltransferase